MRFSQTSKVLVIENTETKSLGVRETAQGPTATAIANAVFAANGQRLRSSPLGSL